MLMALLLLGIVLVVFGAVVLLKYSDRPGGTIKWLGAEVSSKGAGLPLIALGVGCIAYAAVHFPQTALDPNPIRIASDTSCMGALLSGVSKDRVHTVETGSKDREIIGSHLKLDTPFVLLLTDSGQRIGALRVRLYPAS